MLPDMFVLFVLLVLGVNKASVIHINLFFRDWRGACYLIFDPVSELVAMFFSSCNFWAVYKFVKHIVIVQPKCFQMHR